MTEISDHPQCLHVTVYFGGTMCNCVECLKYSNETKIRMSYFQMDRRLTVLRFELLRSTACFVDCRSVLRSDINGSDDLTLRNIY